MENNGFLSFIETVITTIEIGTVKNLTESDEKSIKTYKKTENNVEAMVQKNENNSNKLSIVSYFIDAEIDAFRVFSDLFISTIHIFIV